MSNSARALLLCAAVRRDGEYGLNTLSVLAEGLEGDDMAFDVKGPAYVATNPRQTVVKLVGVGYGVREEDGPGGCEGYEGGCWGGGRGVRRAESAKSQAGLGPV